VCSSKRAVGVAYLKDGIEQQVRIKKEVILSAGAINSPQILLLSGVGPADILQKFDIPMVAGVPGVGHNLQDHLGVLMYFKTEPSFSQFGNLIGGVSFVKTQPELVESDIELLYCPFFFLVPDDSYTMAIVMLNSESQGHVTLRSTDPREPPVIFPNSLAHKTEEQTLVNGIKLARRLSQAPSLAHFTEVEATPGPPVKSEKEILEYVRANAYPFWHPVGTSKMGNDDLSVVDNQLHVHRVERLRIIDASIMPTIVHGNTNAPTIMIGEKGADLIARHV
jgi:choline dehydrogenase